ncbi:MAG: hypothetical protein HFJ79_05910 [Clostridiales bacterium]|nr:hypothetical protein [Clostridiales bacterium]
MESIITIVFRAGPVMVEPSAPQYGGVQGDHQAAKVIFVLEGQLYAPEYRYRLEYVNGTGSYDTTEYLEPKMAADGSGRQIEYRLPGAWTSQGGAGEIRLVTVCLDELNNEKQIVYTVTGRVYYSRRDAGAREGQEHLQHGLSSLIADARAAADQARLGAEEAQAAGGVACTAAADAREAASDARTSHQLAQESAAAAQSAASEAAGRAQEARQAAGEASVMAQKAERAGGDAETAALKANAAADSAQTQTQAASEAAAAASDAAATANIAAKSADSAAQAANQAAEAIDSKADKTDAATVLPCVELFCDIAGDSSYEIDQSATPLTLRAVKGEGFRVVFNKEWKASGTTSRYAFWAGGRYWPVCPAGTYAAGIYIWLFDGETWQVQDALEEVGGTVKGPLDVRGILTSGGSMVATMDTAAAALKGTAEGDTIHLTDGAAGTHLCSAAIRGRTVETGAGIKGPENPYTLSGIKPAALSASGKNLLDLSRIDFSDGCTYSVDGDILTITKTTSAVGSYCARLTQFLIAGTYYIRGDSLSSNGEGAGITILQDGQYIFNQAVSANPAGEFTVAHSGTVNINFYVGRHGQTGDTTTHSRVQLESGTKATDYSLYTGEIYQIPLTVPLFDLPDGTADTFHTMGEQVSRVGSMTLVPDMMWEVSVRTNTTRFVSSVQTDILRESAYNAVLCNYLPTNEVYDDDVAGICLHEGRVVLSLPGNWDTAALFDWMAVPPDGAVTVYYPLTETIATRFERVAVTVPALDTYISAEGASLMVEYNRDINAVIQHLEQALSL